MTQTAPYGTWASPISATLAAESAKAYTTLAMDGTEVYWLEVRPLEGGRTVLMHADGSAQGAEVTPPDMNVRTRVHEYGGGSVLVSDGTVYFSNFADQALYKQSAAPGAEAIKLSVDEALRYADCFHDKGRQRLICVREDHRDVSGDDGEAKNALVAVDLTGPANNGELLWNESDFVAYPRLNAAGDQLAWISWNHPNMPWDNVALWVADVTANGALNNPRRVNPEVDESVLQPMWSPQGQLFVLSDRSGWWNLHRVETNEEDLAIVPVHKLEAELGGPLWGLGADFYALISEQEALVNYRGPQGNRLARLSFAEGVMTPLNLPFAGYGSVHVAGDKAYVLAGRDDAPGAIVEVDLASAEHRVMFNSGERTVAEGYLSRGSEVTFPTANGQQAYGYYYAPINADYRAPEGELPPLLVLMHGGPTASASNLFNISKQYWTSRGIAVIDVNYRGSTGYGRTFRQLLNGQWGVVDLEDAVAVTEYLVAHKLADPQRLLIRGGSAGGYTTLSALAFTDVFAAGANYFGVSDLEALALHTHKFESRYLDSMIGPYPEAIEVYKARSPINALDGFDSPLITFQGLEDRVVPPEQSEKIYEAVKAKGTPTAYIPFEGEQHGFRKAENNITALESELYFYGRVLGFDPHGDLPEVSIDNLPE